jgi:hypothetical protein
LATAQAIAMLLVVGVLLLGAAYGVLWVVARFVHRYVAICMGLSASLYLTYSIIDGIFVCSNAEHACDGPAGGVIRVGLYFVYPVMTVALALITVWLGRRGAQEAEVR